MVQDLPVMKITDNHLKKSVKCEIFFHHYFKIAEEACHLPCNEGCLFHRNCIEYAFKDNADIFDQACDLRDEIIRRKAAYEADNDNQADHLASQLKMLQRIVEYLEAIVIHYEDDMNTYICENSSPSCKRYCDATNNVDLIVDELTILIEKRLTSDLKEGEESVVEGLPAVKIEENNINEDIVSSICLSGLEIAKGRKCHLSCHIFHRNCIQQWLNKKNRCPGKFSTWEESKVKNKCIVA